MLDRLRRDRHATSPAGDQGDLSVNFDQPAGAATGSGRIYLLSPEVLGQPRTLQSVARDVGDTPADAMQALFEGPEHRRAPGTAALRDPAAAPACSTSPQTGGELIVNVSNELQQLTGEALVDGVAQIVLTASEITGVSAVSIAIDGVPQQWPSASGELQSEPLTRYDFPGLVRLVAAGVPLGAVAGACDRRKRSDGSRQQQLAEPTRGDRHAHGCDARAGPRHGRRTTA